MSEEMTAQEIAEHFGVELDDAKKTELEEGGNGSGGTDNDSGGTDNDNGGTDNDNGDTDNGGGTDNDNDGADGGEKQPQDAQERHRQAAARREREEQARQEELRRAIQQARDDVYRDQFAGQTNPFTGKGITTEAEYRAFMAAKAAEEEKKAKEAVSKQFTAAGIDSDAVERMVRAQTDPIEQKMLKMQLGAAREQARLAMQKANEQIAEQIKVINAKYGESFSGVEDIVKGENGKEFNRFVQMGATLEQAYFLANQKAIETKNAKAAYAAGKNAQAGKQHMNPIGDAGGAGHVEVPKAVIEMYREFLPGATMEEIRAAYAAEKNQN